MNDVDWTRALGWLTDAEMVMGDAFSMHSGGADSKIQDEIAHHVVGQFVKAGKRPVPEATLMLFVGKKLPPHLVQPTIELMLLQGRLKEAPIDPKSGRRRFVPGDVVVSQ